MTRLRSLNGFDDGSSEAVEVEIRLSIQPSEDIFAGAVPEKFATNKDESPLDGDSDPPAFTTKSAGDGNTAQNED